METPDDGRRAGAHNRSWGGYRQSLPNRYSLTFADWAFAGKKGRRVFGGGKVAEGPLFGVPAFSSATPQLAIEANTPSLWGALLERGAVRKA